MQMCNWMAVGLTDLDKAGVIDRADVELVAGSSPEDTRWEAERRIVVLDHQQGDILVAPLDTLEVAQGRTPELGNSAGQAGKIRMD